MYESYGMVPIEAAAFNVPTVCHTGKVMGFCDLLKDTEGEVYRTNLEDLTQAGAAVSTLLGLDEALNDTQYNASVELLQRTAKRAKKKALSWNVQAFSKQMMMYVMDIAKKDASKARDGSETDVEIKQKEWMEYKQQMVMKSNEFQDMLDHESKQRKDYDEAFNGNM